MTKRAGLIRILITGANSQTGQSLRTLSEKQGKYHFGFFDRTMLDITDKEAVEKTFDTFKPDVVVNCAAYNAVDKAESEQQRAFKINAAAVEHIARVCGSADIRLIHLSSDYVYNNDLRRPLKEDDPTAPDSVYALSKLAGERKAQESNRRTIIIRTSWLYSEYGHNFLRTMMRLATDLSRLSIVDDQIGCPTYTIDLAIAILRVIEQTNTPRFGNWGIYNYANAGLTTWYDFARLIFATLDVEMQLERISTAEYGAAASRPQYSVLDTSKLQHEFGLEIRPYEQALQACIDVIKAARN